jgi:hypothetical protein
MLRISVWVGVFVLVLASSAVGLCQVVQPALPGYQPGINPCKPQPRAEPVVRNVQVDVPVPCAPPAGCMPFTGCSPHPYCAPPCPPPCPTRPVNVKVEVVVRPEAPKPCVPQTFCCENPPVFEPFICQAVGLVQSVIVSPLGLGEMFMGHPVPLPLPIPTPMPCWRQPVAMRPPCFQPPPGTQCMPPPCPPQARCALPGPSARVKAQPVYAPTSGRPHGPNSPFPR